MHTNLRHSLNVALVAGLLLAAFVVGMHYDFSTMSTPASTQPALPVSPTNIEVSSAASRTSEEFDPAVMVFMAPPPTGTPETSALVPDVASAAVSNSVNSQIIEPAKTAQPDQDRTPTRLVIPAIELDAPVEPVGWYMAEIRNSEPVNVWAVPDYFAAGWLKTSAPVGLPGNTVLDGHHNILGMVFKDLVKLVVGDLITLYAGDLKYVYRVEQRLILEEVGQSVAIRQANAQYIYPTADERLTLVTCWPRTSNTHRLIIIALPVSLLPSDLPVNIK